MRNTKINILFLAYEYGKNNYMGGIYYIKSMVYALGKCKAAQEEFRIYVYTDSEHADEYKSLEEFGNVSLIVKKMPSPIKKRIIDYLDYKTRNFKKHNSIISSKIIKDYKIDLIYPLGLDPQYQRKGMYWIPDFQHEHFPELFSQEELAVRREIIKNTIDNTDVVVLSSMDAYEDFVKLYGVRDGVRVIPFVSTITVPKIDPKIIRAKYGINKRYFLISNQFYAHKNHITVFKAIQELNRQQKRDVLFVFTGLMNDYRNPRYIEDLKDLIAESNLDEFCIFLGLIPRDEQIVLIDNCEAIIQPSHFEGWNTLIEDAKTLKQNIIASDINVHLEQKVENCLFFEKDNYIELAKLIEGIIEGTIRFDVSTYEYDEKAKEYGKLFYDAIKYKLKMIED